MQETPGQSQQPQQQKRDIRDRKSLIIFEHELLKNAQSIKITRYFVDKPFHVIGVYSIIFLICIILTVAFNTMQMSENNMRDFLIWSDIRVQEYDMIEEASSQLQQSLGGEQLPIRSQDRWQWSLQVMLYCEKDCQNVLQKQYLDILVELQQEIVKIENYENLCLATPTSSECGPQSLISLFDKTKVANQQTIEASLDLAEQDELVWNQIKFLLGADYNHSKKHTKLIRSIFKFGLPLKIDGKTFRDPFDDFNGQKEYMQAFSQKLIEMRAKYDEKYKDIRVLFFSFQIDQMEFQKEVDTDFLWAFASILFVWIYISIHLKSFFLGCFAMFNILMSFPLSLVIFRFIFQIKFFSSLHILAIFLVLGIAADDVFVFMDAWNQTKLYHILQGDLNKRMAVTFRRAAKAMLATSSTTSAAFFATGLSTIMPISSFGFFAGVLIPSNYLLVITFFPALLIVQEKYLKNGCCKKKNLNKVDTETPRDSQLRPSILKQQYEPKLEKFLFNEYNTFIFKARHIILAVFVVWTGIAIWRTSEMKPLSKPEKFLPDEHYTEIGEQLINFGFQQSGQSQSGIKVKFFWGVKDISQDGVSKWDSQNLGKIIWDDDFDLSSTTNQQYFLDNCVALKQNSLVQDGHVECFMETFQLWLQVNGKSFPVPQSDFLTEIGLFIKDPAGGLLLFNQNRIGLIKGELKFVAIELASVGIPFKPYEELNPLYLKWKDLIEEQNEQAPEGLKNARQTGSFNWVWMVTEQAFVTNAIQGMTISLIFSFFVLILSTLNIIMSLYSILSICCIVVSVVAVMELQGWELGIAESVTIVILIGLSVDFVVHLANHYVECAFPDRFRRVQISLKEIGISILSGALTTQGAGFFLFFGELIVFNKFALLIVATISFSLLYSMLFFVALLHLAGPEGQFGNLLILCQKKQDQQKNQDSNSISSNSSCQNEDKNNQNDIQITPNNNMEKQNSQKLLVQNNNNELDTEVNQQLSPKQVDIPQQQNDDVQNNQDNINNNDENQQPTNF